MDESIILSNIRDVVSYLYLTLNRYSAMLKFILSLTFCCIIFFENIKAQGNGSDGTLTVTGTTTINTVLSAVSGSNSAGNTINVASTTGFAVNDVVLIIQMDGTNAGSYNELVISSLTSTAITFTSATSVTYSSTGSNRAQIIRIPQYIDVTINSGATLTASAWNGTTGGVLIFYSNGTVTNNGTITMNGKGFTGGTGGSGNSGGAAGTTGTGATTTNGMGGNASPLTGGSGGGSSAGTGGTGGIGNSAAIPNLGSSGNGVGAGSPGTAGTNSSSGMSLLVMGGGGGGGQGGQGGQGGGSGGGGGAASTVGIGAGKGSAGSNGIAGSASTGVGGNGGTGGGIVLARLKKLVGNGTVTSNGNAGGNATGTGGAGGNGGDGGNGGAFLIGAALTNGGGGGGGGKGGQGGQGPGGGGAGGAGIIAMDIGTNSWSGTFVNNPGTGGTGGSGGTSGSSGNGGTGGFAFLFGVAGLDGATGGTVAASLNGPSGASNTLGSGPIIVLPITLISFDGFVNGDLITIYWITAEEINNAYFIIEKSLDGKKFEKISIVAGQSKSTTMKSYSINDETPFIGVNYYRIKQVDLDGTVFISNVIAVDYIEQKISIYPNPVNKDRLLKISSDIANFVNGTRNLKVFNSTGELVFEKDLNESLQQNIVQLPVELLPGVYFIEYSSFTSSYKDKIILD